MGRSVEPLSGTMSKIARALGKADTEKHNRSSMAMLDDKSAAWRLSRAATLVMQSLVVQSSKNGHDRGTDLERTLEEVTQLRNRVSEFQETNRLLTSSLAATIHAFRSRLKTEPESHASLRFEDFDTADLEALIFIGREKG